MNANAQSKLRRARAEAPLFASPWLALILVLRKEFGYSRPER